MTPEAMRAELLNVYKGPTWAVRVKGMDDKQVIAIYLAMKREGRLYEHVGQRQVDEVDGLQREYRVNEGGASKRIYNFSAGCETDGSIEKGTDIQEPCEQVSIWDILEESGW